MGVNRGKKSVVPDLKTSAGREALAKLVDTADVLMHSIRPQKLKSIDLDPQTLRTRNPRLVYAGLHGFAEERQANSRRLPARHTSRQRSGCAHGTTRARTRRGAQLMRKLPSRSWPADAKGRSHVDERHLHQGVDDVPARRP